MKKTMPAIPDRARLQMSSPGAKVDREHNIIRGYVVAEKGPFKSRRGQFDDESLRLVVSIMAASEPQGLKSRFTHPSMSDDGLGSFLGRAHNARLEDGKVKADLHLDRTAFDTPRGNLAKYVMDLAESDPDALSSSLVLNFEEIHTFDEDGRPKTDADGELIPPIWRPTKLLASDIVDTGDAVGGLLSAGVNVDGLPLAELWRGSEMLDRVFAGQTADTIRARCNAFLERYLAAKFGKQVKPTKKVAKQPKDDGRAKRARARLAELERKKPLKP